MAGVVGERPSDLFLLAGVWGKKSQSRFELGLRGGEGTANYFRRKRLLMKMLNRVIPDAVDPSSHPLIQTVTALLGQKNIVRESAESLAKLEIIDITCSPSSTNTVIAEDNQMAQALFTIGKSMPLPVDKKKLSLLA
ncbi:hypothetical protein llap_3370 [Limosa lapponica baueri]|uniref:Uncharacterized protein n=1 Tax=Limosa lapponica baueri TaxID=1758121 RepID=A0A2I0UJS2_LIMLA|nr:hypothetical protein llap_3370 [Limosa lapponica baueri]